MLMTGRYPTRTGFEFTPTPSGLAPMISRISEEMNRGAPPMLYDAALDETKPPYEEQGLPPEEVTIAEVLKDKGYATFHMGSGIWGVKTAWRHLNRALTRACSWPARSICQRTIRMS